MVLVTEDWAARGASETEVKDLGDSGSAEGAGWVEQAEQVAGRVGPATAAQVRAEVVDSVVWGSAELGLVVEGWGELVMGVRDWVEDWEEEAVARGSVAVVKAAVDWEVSSLAGQVEVVMVAVGSEALGSVVGGWEEWGWEAWGWAAAAAAEEG
ncbi:hypothetical protein HXX76_011793 [Chlamydomonas incerta]|uniref:Uncharacterized protein n=1 Tax=Chlamydomonas incerta TaxID=51695 RepID=A0A835VSY2_CHLIN|nr:hypothetical protein HXX76_011793 [Chlamydomonas incerta]|eukprot:KAG2428112.1 hypothetical protein HXX76_011793 [Chlamydomonas incerta]